MRTYTWLTRSITGLLFILAWFLPATHPQARPDGDWYVRAGGSDANACTAPASACATIQGALSKAVPGDTIYIDSSSYAATSGAQVLHITKNIHLSGGWDASFSSQEGMTTLDGGNARLVMLVDAGVSASAWRMHLTRGFYTSGGGLYNQGELNLSHSLVEGNDGYGGSNGHGGGIANSASAVLNLRDSAVVHNNAYGGGGILNNGVLVIVNSTIAENEASFGGGIENHGTAQIFSTTIAKNFANTGGGVYSLYSGMALQNTILSDNTSSNGYSADCYGTLASLGYNLIGSTDGCTIPTPGPGDQILVDPSLGLLVGNPPYIPLMSISLAIDAGDPVGCKDETGADILTDQRGVARSGICDSGAYEYKTPGAAASLSVYGGSPQSAQLNAQFSSQLLVLALDDNGSPAFEDEVTFTAPASGPSAIFLDTGTRQQTVLVDETGLAYSSYLRANALSGAYQVVASAGSAQAHFELNNIGALYLPFCWKPCDPLFFDNFNNPASGWPIVHEDEVTLEYTGGEYRMYLRYEEYGAGARPSFTSFNYYMSVDVRNPNNIYGSYGLVFGLDSVWSTFYTLEIFPDGYYGVYHFLPTQIVTIASGPSSAIRQGPASNHLEVRRENGVQYKIYINGIQHATTPDTTYTDNGYMGIIGFTYNKSRLDLRFDNFTVRPLTCDGKPNPPSALQPTGPALWRGPAPQR